MIFAVDWDGTLVDTKTQAWLPDAEWALNKMLGRHEVVVHTCRVLYPEGKTWVEQRLQEHAPRQYGLGRLTVAAKPQADRYIDNLAVTFDGNWPELIRRLPRERGE